MNKLILASLLIIGFMGCENGPHVRSGITRYDNKWKQTSWICVESDIYDGMAFREIIGINIYNVSICEADSVENFCKELVQLWTAQGNTLIKQHQNNCK
jgi:hypothetical protein